LRTSLYHTDYKDKITLGTDPASGKGQWQNIAVTRVNGVEIAFQGNLGNGWLPYTNFSYTKAENQAAAGAVFTQATRVAPRKLNLGVTYEPNSMWSATLNGRAVSGLYFNNLTAAQWSGGCFQADAKVSAKLPFWGEKWEAFRQQPDRQEVPAVQHRRMVRWPHLHHRRKWALLTAEAMHRPGCCPSPC
jgi:outer membrane receptor protein involved in Fe transport